MLFKYFCVFINMWITLILLLGISMLSIEISYHAVLARQIKELLYLTDYQLQTIKILSRPRFWKELKWWLTPLCVPFFIYHEIGLLVNCQYCTSTWLGFFFALAMGYPIIQCIALAGLCIAGVLLIEKTIL